MTPGATDDVIELRVDEIAQLFHTLDPFPFRERDLDREAEEFIVGWARELPTDQPIKARLRKIWQKHSEGIFPTGRPYSRVTSLSSSGLVAARWASAWSC
jgi:hypothetical protein